MIERLCNDCFDRSETILKSPALALYGIAKDKKEKLLVDTKKLLESLQLIVEELGRE